VQREAKRAPVDGIRHTALDSLSCAAVLFHQAGKLPVVSFQLRDKPEERLTRSHCRSKLPRSPTGFNPCSDA
jgi:hypothetical protein